MKIIHIIDNVGAGGAQVMVKAFLNHYPNANAFALRQLSHQPNNDNRIDVYPSKTKFSIQRVFWLKSIINTNPTAIFHLHLINTVYHFTLIKILFGLKNQIVIHEHGEIHKADFTGSLLRWCYKNFSKSTHFIAVSNDVQQELISLRIPIKNTSVINNIGFNQFLSRKETLPFVVGFCGRIEPRKNWKFFAELALKLKDKNDFHFLMAGSGPEEKKLIDFIKDHGLKNLKFLGYQINMQDFYGTINCMIIPSFWEGSSLVQQEALNSNIPVISFSGKGMSTDSKLNFIMNQNSLEECKEAIYKIQENYNQLIITTNSDFNLELETYFENIDEVYQKLIPNLHANV
jgi:glycosyltransferase involved in cell wall biosynthesis